MAQKYLLEAIDAPIVKSYAFFTEQEALEWIDRTTFPKVFKLKSGAGAYNVSLIKSRDEARKYVKRAFGKGFLATYRGAVLRDKIWQFKRKRSLKSLFDITKGIYRYIFPNSAYSRLPLEKNYLYVQDFIPNCDHDIRVFVIGDRAVTKKRFVRDGDFRASGSGVMSWDIGDDAKSCIEMAFDISDRLNTQSLAFDFVKDVDGYKIVEVSYSHPLEVFQKALDIGLEI